MRRDVNTTCLMIGSFLQTIIYAYTILRCEKFFIVVEECGDWNGTIDR
jgi:hypothetical protein